MAYEAPTVDQAEAMIGRVGDVVHPNKGKWEEGPYKIVGYNLDAEDPEKVVSYRADSLARVPEKILYDPRTGKESGRIAEHVAYSCHNLNPRWFKPAVDPGVA